MTTGRVLVFRTGSMGDTIVSIPAFKLIRKSFPGRQIYLMTNKPRYGHGLSAHSILFPAGLVDQTFYFTEGSRLSQVWALVLLFFFEFEAIIYLSELVRIDDAPRHEKFLRLLRSKKLIGFGVGNNLSPLSEGGMYEHEAKRILRSINQIGIIDLDDKQNWSLNLTNAEIDGAKEILAAKAISQFIAIAIGTARPSTDWGLDRWQKLLTLIGTELPDWGIVLIGHEKDRVQSERLKAVSPENCHNLCGTLSLRQTAAIMSRAALFIGPDSGPGHLAASLGVACISIVSARNRPGIWFPYGAENIIHYTKISCSGCGLEVCVDRNNECLMAISPLSVLNSIQNLLKARLAAG